MNSHPNDHDYMVRRILRYLVTLQDRSSTGQPIGNQQPRLMTPAQLVCAAQVVRASCALGEIVSDSGPSAGDEVKEGTVKDDENNEE